jgi:hypothetical protein
MQRCVVLWNPDWHVLECQRREGTTDLSGAMAGAIEGLASEGWQLEGSVE